MLQVRLLGQFDVQRDGTAVVIPSRAAQSLFAYLLLTTGTTHRREELAGLIWPDTTEENARKNLRNELWRLRKAIEIGTSRKKAIPYLVVDEISIGFNPPSEYWLDVAVLQKALIEPVAADPLIETLSLYRGDLLPGLYDDWVLFERERVRAAFEQKMARLLDLLVVDKRWQDILTWGERWIALGQTPEPAYRALMVAHGANGNVSQVASVYERCIQAMRNDLGVEPSEQMRMLFERLSKNEKIPQSLFDNYAFQAHFIVDFCNAMRSHGRVEIMPKNELNIAIYHDLLNKLSDHFAARRNLTTAADAYKSRAARRAHLSAVARIPTSL